MEETKEDTSELMKELDDRFRQVRRLINLEWNRDNIHGLGITHGRILMMLAEEGPQKASAMAEAMKITSGAVTGLADRLVELGFISRERGEADRRVVLLEITEEGRKLISNLEEIKHSIMKRLFSGMSEQEMRNMLRYCNIMIDNFEREA
ncbi:MarR family winged helix-turn-helix transcriptional regulator [Paenibacillus beijingensis]|uniref:HTH marR-type domain-containing protein n=1 Tax=Paenibacillus beijingensis TaxID=1126833 RepID=A0A0D5NLK6_9BACL|nr:MarR family transcriptional regulator [Paenibacillus beijingensis]AJY76126.1 hypothetical protein VN24_18135 [Paenibacillus beijingensis]